MQILNGRRHRVESLAFSHCGRWLAAGGRGGVHLWDTTKPAERAKQVTVKGSWARYHNLAFRPDGLLFFTTWDWFVADPETATRVRVATQKYGGFAVAPDGTRAVSIPGATPLRTYRIGREKATAGPTVSVPRTFFLAAAYTSDGARLAVVETAHASRKPSRCVSLRDADSGKCSAVLTPPRGDLVNLLFSRDGSRLVGWERDCLACWEVSNPEEPPRTATNPSGDPFLSMAFHPDGKLLTVDNDRVVRVWDAATLTPEQGIEWNVGKLYAVAVSPDGARAAVGSHTGKVLVWDWD